MFTSNFARLKRIPLGLEAVSIARFPPRWAGKIRRYMPLAPAPELFKLESLDDFVNAYIDALCKLDPRAIVADLTPNGVACCFCPPGFFCHRRIVAEFLEERLGIEIPELGFARALLPPWQEAPWKGQTEDLPWEAACDHCRAQNMVTLSATRCRCVKCKKMFSVEFDSE